MNKVLILMFALTALMFSCGSTDGVDPLPDPDPKPLPGPDTLKPIEETRIVVGTYPDSIKVESSVTIKFTVSQKDHPEDFLVTVDTVNAYYYKQRATAQTPGGLIPYYADKVFGKADIRMNGKKLGEVGDLKDGEENVIEFFNPDAVGEYGIILNITDKNGNITRKEIRVKTWSPEIVIKFYDVDPWIELRYDEDQFYEKLNQNYTYDPLSSYFVGKRVDTIYIQEEFESVLLPDGSIGYDSVTTTIPGQGIVCYVGQEGGEDFLNLRGSYGLLLKDGKSLSTTDFACKLDGTSAYANGKQGFHGILFQTSTHTKVGSLYYTVRVVDKWGKEKIETIVYKAFGMKEKIPEHCIPSKKHWWAHYISD